MKIELDRVGKSYGKQRVLDDVSFVVEPGARVALVGPNGSGKSTLLRIVMGLLRCDGQVRLDGVSPFEARGEVARRLAYVPQIAPQLGATVQEVVRAVSTLRDIEPARVREVAERLGISLDDAARKPFRALSGGMKQKVLLALAFSTSASLLILDEPTASLDETSRARFLELLSEAGDATVLLCSHRIEEVQKLAGRVIELSEGRVLRDLTAITTPNEIAPPTRCHGGRR